VTSLARPNGNLTGFGIMAIEIWPKRLELLLELMPQAKVIGLLVNPTSSVKRHIQEFFGRAVKRSS
jgi:putative tryptophan/tyrosine transport system substrate-binding protein